MKVSPAGRASISAREGRRLLAYKDSVGVWTIGVGHTGRMSPPAVHGGMRITDAQCDAFLATDLAPVEKAIAAIGVALGQNQFDALASLAFNIGTHGFSTSSVVRRLREGDLHAAADAFLLWNNPSVLKTRREAERAQFLTPDGVPMSKTTMAAMHGVEDALKKAAAGSSFPPDKPVAPAAAAPASSSAATERVSPMTASTSTTAIAAAHPKVAAALPGVNLLQGIINFGEHMVGSLTAGAAAIVNPALPGVTGQPSSSGFFGTLGNVKAAAEKLNEIIADAKKGDVQEAVADGIDLLKLIMATLDVFHINVPVLGTVVAGLGSPHAGGVDKPAA